MKVMDEEMKTDDCEILETSTPPKAKKLKQARLPFQMISSVSPNVSTKKRKLSSPVSSRSPKVQKVAKKENSLKTTDVGEIGPNEEKEEAETSINATGSPDTLGRSKDKKSEGKGLMKPGALTRFLQKAPATVAKSTLTSKDTESDCKIKQPIILLDRCDDESQNDKPPVPNNPPEDDVKQIVQKFDESSNECLAEILSDSEKEGNRNSLDKTQESEYESESEISVSEEDTQEDQKSNEDSEDNEVPSNDKNLDETPQTDKSANMLSLIRRKLTPKQLEKKMESAKKREEREKLKAEREKQRIQEKMKRRKEHEDRRKERRERKEAENELKKRDREQKELKKQMEIEQKQKEREQKEKAKEDEKRKKEEERIEAERKKQKAASTFVSFFFAKKQENKTSEEEKPVRTSNFMPFEIKADMKVAPTCRRNLSDEDKFKFDLMCLKNEGNSDTPKLWLDQIRKNENGIRKSGKTWPAETKDDIVVIEEDDVGSANVVDETRTIIENQRAKLLSFTENRRPPYWGTWRKKSEKINPKNPFIKDTKFFDYDVDSDEEWEEEEPGESLRGSDDEKEEENADDNEYDVDNDFMVPHGYLSDSEARPDEEDEEDTSPETQKFKLKILGEQFEAEMNAKTAKIKPRVIGCYWQNSSSSYPEIVPEKVIKFLMARQAWTRETPIVLRKPAEPELSHNSEKPNEKSDTSKGPKKTRMPDEALPDLIKLIHGNNLSRPFLVKEFITFWSRKHSGEGQLSKACVANKIGELAKRMACPEEGLMHLKNCWYVSEETRNKYHQEALTLPNQWSYILTPKRKMMTEEGSEKEGRERPKESEKIRQKEPKEKERKCVPLITQFTQKITQEEMKKQLKTFPSPKSASPLNRPPKRASLISVARGEQFSKSPNIVTAFSKITENSKSDASNSGTSVETIILDSDSKKNLAIGEIIHIDDSSSDIQEDTSEKK